MKVLYTLLILLIPFVGFGQSNLDVVHYRDWSVIKVKVIEENQNTIKYKYKNEDLIITENINKISKIIFSSGRTRQYNNKIGTNPDVLFLKIKNDSISKANKKLIKKKVELKKIKKKVELRKFKDEFSKKHRSSLSINSGFSHSNLLTKDNFFENNNTQFNSGHFHSIKYNFNIKRHNISFQTSFIQKGWIYVWSVINTLPDGGIYLPNIRWQYDFNYLNFSTSFNLRKMISRKMTLNYDLGPSLDFYISDRIYTENLEVTNNFIDTPGFNKFIFGLYSSTSLSYMIDKIHFGLGIGVNYSLSKIINRSEEVFDTNTGITYGPQSFNTITFTNFVSISYLFD